MNLVIHELLMISVRRLVSFFELLIGGPNQSHKVNFKELPLRGKISSKNFYLTVVNTFLENFLKELTAN